MKESKVKFNINCEMDAMFAPIFVSMLKKIQQDCNWGHSEFVGIYTDGDGSDTAKFEFDMNFEEVKPNISNSREDFAKLACYPEIGTYFGSCKMKEESWSMHYNGHKLITKD